MIKIKPNSSCIETKIKAITTYLFQGGGTIKKMRENIVPDELSGASIKKLRLDSIVKWMVYYNTKGKTKAEPIDAFQMTIFEEKLHACTCSTFSPLLKKLNVSLP